VKFSRPSVRNYPQAPRHFQTIVQASDRTAAVEAARDRMKDLYSVERLDLVTAEVA
jgi:hypothetical protein